MIEKDKDNLSKIIKTDKTEKVEKVEKVEEDDYFIQPPSDSEYDICGPLNCDKEL